jgi:hypothetical protein
MAMSGSAPDSDLRALQWYGPHTNPANIPVPVAGRIRLFFDLDGCLAYKKSDGSVISLCATGWSVGDSVPRQLVRRWAYVVPFGESTNLQSQVAEDYLTFSGPGGASGGNQAPDASNGYLAFWRTGTTANSTTGLEGRLNWRTGRNLYYSVTTLARQTTNERIFFGYTDQTLATMLASDDPAGNYAVFRYSTVASDVAWQAITKDGATQNVVSTGIAVQTATASLFTIQFDDTAGNVKFSISGTVVATLSTNLPSTSTNMRFIWGIINPTGANQRLDYGVIYMEGDE